MWYVIGYLLIGYLVTYVTSRFENENDQQAGLTGAVCGMFWPLFIGGLLLVVPFVIVSEFGLRRGE